MIVFSKKLLSLVLLLQLTLIQPFFRGNSTKNIAVSVGLAAGFMMQRYISSPDTKIIPFNKFTITTFLPIDIPAHDSARTEEDILAVLKNGSGDIHVNGKTYRVSSGIPEDIATIQEPVTILATGYNPFELLSFRTPVMGHRGYIALKQGTIEGPLVAYDTPYQKRTNLNFGKPQDIDAFKKVYDTVIKKNPDADIIFHGICKGALTQLYFLHNQEDVSRVKAMILESPLLSFKHILSTINVDYPLLRSFITKYLFPNTGIEHTLIPELQLPAIPILVGILPCDKITRYEPVITFFKENTHADCPANLFMSNRKDLVHAKIGEDTEFVASIKEFLDQKLGTHA